MRRTGALKCISVSLLFVLLIGQSLALCIFIQPVCAIDVESMLKDGLKKQLPPAIQQTPIKVERKVQKLDDLIQRQDIPYSFPPMIPLQGISITGLGPKAIACLGESYFVVRSNSNATSMVELYRQNRQASKANFVTMDCVVHPYLSFCNRISADTIKRHLLPLTKNLLQAMLRVAVGDYKQSDDEEVRADIESNIAFLSLALKLMDPAFAIPALGRVPQMVQADYDSVVFAKPGKSAIYERNEDFSFYRPQGWYRNSPELITFYRVKTWLSRLNYPINDVTFESNGVRANNFRRSVLLYRCLDLARVDGKPAYEAWTRLVKSMFILGSHVENWQDRNLYAHDYKSVFKINTNSDLKMTISALSEPLYRTKLLLAVRKQKPLSLGSTSIFDLEETQGTKESVAAFRFIPFVGSPEDPWLSYAANLYPKIGVNTNVFPVALLDLNAWGAPQAGNFLLDSSWAMDESMPKTVTELKRWVLRRALGGQVQPVESRIWSVLTPAWRLLPEGIQTALRCEMWANRRMESVFCAWLDSRLSIAPAHYAGTKTSAPDTSADTTSESSSDGESGLDDAMRNLPTTPAPTAPNKSGPSSGPGAQGRSGASSNQSAPSAAGGMQDNNGARTMPASGSQNRNGVQASPTASGSQTKNGGAQPSPASGSQSKTGGAQSMPASGSQHKNGAQSPASGSQNKSENQSKGVQSTPAGGHQSKSASGISSLSETRSAALSRPGSITGAVSSTSVTSSGTKTDDIPRPAVKPSLQRRASRGHFLDPCPDFYNRLVLDAQKIEKEMLALGFPLEPNLKRGLDDYSRLFQRFSKIAKDEVEGKTPVQEDLNLLGNIDVILDKIDVPLPAVLAVPPLAKFDSATPISPEDGFTMGLGRPGVLYIILMNKNTREWTLARGAVYTYYEHPGTTMTEEELLSRIDKGTIQAPYWTERFDFVQADKK